jgi:hypothetical protein
MAHAYRRSILGRKGKPSATWNKHRGAENELRAITWLLSTGHEVWRAVSQHGAIDLIAQPKDGEMLFLDVKSQSSLPSPEQRQRGVRFLIVGKDGSCTLQQDRADKACSECGQSFAPRNAQHRFCGEYCRGRARRARIKSQANHGLSLKVQP